MGYDVPFSTVQPYKPGVYLMWADMYNLLDGWLDHSARRHGQGEWLLGNVDRDLALPDPPSVELPDRSLGVYSVSSQAHHSSVLRPNLATSHLGGFAVLWWSGPSAQSTRIGCVDMMVVGNVTRAQGKCPNHFCRVSHRRQCEALTSLCFEDVVEGLLWAWASPGHNCFSLPLHTPSCRPLLSLPIKLPIKDDVLKTKAILCKNPFWWPSNSWVFF